MDISKLLTITGLMVSPLVLSAGFQLNEQSVSSLARANAGRGAVGDNAADIAQNPAISSLFSRQQITLTASYADPSVNVKGVNESLGTRLPEIPGFSLGANVDNIAQSELIPGFYYVLPFHEGFSFGLSVNTFYGMGVKYPVDFGASEFVRDMSISSVHVTPSVAYKINEELSVGVGLSYVHGSGEFNTSSSYILEYATARGIPKGVTLTDIKGDGSDFGWSVGALWKINDHSRLGFSYRSETDIKTNVDLYVLGSTERGKKGKGSMTLTLPSVAEIGYYNQFSKTFALALGIQYTDWSLFKDFSIDIFKGPNTAESTSGHYVVKEENWKSTLYYSIGVDYNLNKNVILRAGYAYDQASAPRKNMTLSIPNGSRNWYTFGATFNLHRAGVVDLGFAYIMGEHSKFSESLTGLSDGKSSKMATSLDGSSEVASDPLTMFHGQFSKLDAMILSIGYSYKF